MAQRSWKAKLLAMVSISCGVFATVIIFGKRNALILGNESALQNPICTWTEESEVDFNKLVTWANNIETLQKTDESRHKLLWDETLTSEDLNLVRDGLYKYVNHPMQGVCKVGKYFGGIWLPGWGCLDGHKYVCLDTLYEDVLKNQCLIYSFGINNEWSFEENMISMGCTIRSFDPTIDGSSKPKTDLVTFQKIGLADQARGDGVNEFVTLSEAINRMGDTGRRISYLKVDIEGSELSAMKDWITSGVLEYVSQIGIEIHSTHSKENGNGTLFGLLETFRSLDKAGFKLINISNNECAGKNFDFNHQFYTIFELVFYKHLS